MPNLGQGGCQAMEDAYVLNQELQRITHKSQIPDALAKYQDRRFIRASAVQGLSRFASDIIIRGFDTPAKMTWNETTGALQFENCNYAGLVTRLLQPFLPIFFAVQFNFLYDGYRNEKGKIDVPATIGFTLLGHGDGRDRIIDVVVRHREHPAVVAAQPGSSDRRADPVPGQALLKKAWQCTEDRNEYKI
jgi:hypothetical protein